jgi:hypothetical protein
MANANQDRDQNGRFTRSKSKSGSSSKAGSSHGGAHRAPASKGKNDKW